MLKLLQKWHWIHTWSPWYDGPEVYFRYPWTAPGHYTHKQITQSRECKICNLGQARVVHT